MLFILSAMNRSDCPMRILLHCLSTANKNEAFKPTNQPLKIINSHEREHSIQTHTHTHTH